MSGPGPEHVETGTAAADGPGERPEEELPRWRAVLDPLVSAVVSRMGIVYVLTFQTLRLAPLPGTGAVAETASLLSILAVPWMVRHRRVRTVVLAVLLLAVASGTLTHGLLALHNHHVLTLYWLLALLLTGLATDPVDALRRSARWLLVLVFVFATLWKLLVPDFADGSFTTYLLVADRQFDRITTAVDWHEPEVGLENGRIVRSLLYDPSAPYEPQQLEVPDRTVIAGRILALATIALEGAVTLVFLLPLRGRWRLARDAVLAVFLLSTYALLPVFGFGALLAIMGLASSALPERPATLTYLALWLALIGFSWTVA